MRTLATVGVRREGMGDSPGGVFSQGGDGNTRGVGGNGGISEKKESSRMISESGGANSNAGPP